MCLDVTLTTLKGLKGRTGVGGTALDIGIQSQEQQGQQVGALFDGKLSRLRFTADHHVKNHLKPARPTQTHRNGCRQGAGLDQSLGTRSVKVNEILDHAVTVNTADTMINSGSVGKDTASKKRVNLIPHGVLATSR